MPHFYRTPAKFRAPNQSNGNHTSCFRVGENCLMAWRRYIFPSGIAHLGCDLQVSFSEVLSTWVLSTMRTTTGSWQPHLLNIWRLGFLGLHGEITQKAFHLAMTSCPGSPSTCLIYGRWLLRVLCWFNSPPIYKTAKIFLKNISLFISRPRKKIQVGKTPLSLANQEKDFRWVQSEVDPDSCTAVRSFT